MKVIEANEIVKKLSDNFVLIIAGSCLYCVKSEDVNSIIIKNEVLMFYEAIQNEIVIGRVGDMNLMEQEQLVKDVINIIEG